MKIAGLDIGTTGCKCTVFDESGKYLDRAYREYVRQRKVGAQEIDVSVIMGAVYECIGEMANAYPDIEGIGVTSFGETFVCVDDKGAPLAPAMLYTDPRGEAECRELCEKLGERHIAEITGLRPHEMYSISKIKWMKKHQPEVFAKTRHLFLMEDYVVYHLTGKKQIDYSLATRTMAFDISTLTWSKEVFAAAEIDVNLMSTPVPIGTTAGKITKETAEKTGLSKETQVVSISHDQVAAAVGAGAFDSQVAVDGAGTVECLTPIYDGIPDMDAMYQGYFSVVPYVIPGKYVAYSFSYTGGALLQWCVDTLAKAEKELAKAEGCSINSYLERKYLEEKGEEPLNHLMVLPHFAGAATPYMDSGSKGVILGLDTETTVTDIYRGCMEGIVYEMYLNLQALLPSGIHFQKLHATGGGAHSEVLMQMKADVLNLPITALKTVDAGTVGSGMLTGIALGRFANLEEAASYMVEETRVYEPRMEMHEKYMKHFERYKEIYKAVRPLV